ncbi:MAG TPA: MerR family transcriptional regulator, partial [Rhodospirillales bacterium]|nr:MerR family transcriptional regulator [Rhodospirillales bacterium]
RPEDVALLRRIRSLLYTEGYTIKGVQRLLREGGGRTTPAPEPSEEPSRDEEAAAGAPVLAAPPAIRPGDGGDSELRAVLAELEALRALLREQGY